MIGAIIICISLYQHHNTKRDFYPVILSCYCVFVISGSAKLLYHLLLSQNFNPIKAWALLLFVSNGLWTRISESWCAAYNKSTARTWFCAANTLSYGELRIVWGCSYICQLIKVWLNKLWCICHNIISPNRYVNYRNILILNISVQKDQCLQVCSLLAVLKEKQGKLHTLVLVQIWSRNVSNV